MGSHISDAHNKPNRPMWHPATQKLLRAPPVPPLPQDKFWDPLVLYMEAWVAEKIFGPKQASVPEIKS